MSDQAANIKFVQEVEKHPILYNYKLPGYSRRDETEKAWNEVAKKVNINAEECKDKWRNLRTVFARRMKPPPSGSATKKKPYYLADVMQFALPFIKTSIPPSSGNLPEVSDNENSEAVPQEYETEAYNDYGDDPPPSPTPPSPQRRKNPSASTSASVQAEDDETDVSSQKQHKKKMAPKKKAEFEADKSVAAYFTAKKAKLNVNTNQRSTEADDKKEALKMFLLSLMPELTQFSDSQVKLFKRRVLSLIDEISLVGTNSLGSATMESVSIRQFPQPWFSSTSSSTCASLSPTPSLVQVQQPSERSQFHETSTSSLSATSSLVQVQKHTEQPSDVSEFYDNFRHSLCSDYDTAQQ